MTRDEIAFSISYSIRLEKMQSTFLARIDRASNFCQLLLGIAVIATNLPILTGILVSTLAAFSFVYQPAIKSIEARAQKQKYEKLQGIFATLTDKELTAQFGEIQATDSLVIGSLMHPAHFSEYIRLGKNPDYELTRFEKLVAFIAGDLPRR